MHIVIPKAKLLASSPTLEGVQDCIAKFYCGSRKELRELVQGKWTVHGPDGVQLRSVYVELKKGRYRFVMVPGPSSPVAP